MELGKTWRQASIRQFSITASRLLRRRNYSPGAEDGGILIG